MIDGKSISSESNGFVKQPGVLRLQEQLQAERDLRAALEVGLSMFSGQDSGSNRAMDSKVAKKDVTSRYHHLL
ncbi:hypothetical protein Tco_0860716 [Tanacetum coccineum]|uniref:Uncharacterized protein n=1 Tax=Tanacetum coccineum TaxID=301880 RepID=A0ABQ5BLF4_9ASTR